MRSTYHTEHPFSFLKEEPVVAGFITVREGCVKDPLVLETIFRFHSLLLIFAQGSTLPRLTAVKTVDFGITREGMV